MVELFQKEVKEDGRQSSKGNQLKFERDGIWYKADYLGYEGLVEYTVSKLLGFSDLDRNEYVDYDPEEFTEEEYEALLDFAVSLNIEQAFIQDREVADESFIPAFDYTGLF